MMPSGTMQISTQNFACSGTNSRSSIVIRYTIKAAKKLEYHENPGVRHGSKNETAYLPDNEEGWDLILRLKYAFSHGLTFTVGTSLTTGQQNAVMWASIHHKTRPSGGAHGFPDPSFFVNANEELTTAGVPKANDLR